MNTLFSTPSSCSLLLVRIQLHWEDKLWHQRMQESAVGVWGVLGSSISSQIRDRPTTAGQQVTWLKGHWSGSFIHTLLAGVPLTCGKGVSTSVISDELQLRKATWDSCLSKHLSVSKIHTRQILEFSGPNVWFMVKIISVKVRKRLPVNNGWLFPLVVVSQPMTLAHSAQ